MRFTITYDGNLPSASSRHSRLKEKWEIRRQIHQQMSELWTVDERLKEVEYFSKVDKNGTWVVETHHSIPYPERDLSDVDKASFIDVCEPISVGGGSFRPLICERLSTTCKLDILFMRKENPGMLMRGGGDIDNRLKVLFDGLRVPKSNEMECFDSSDPSPFYCLLEDDIRVDELNLRTARLLSSRQGDPNQVRLIIDVTLRVNHIRYYNLALVG